MLRRSIIIGGARTTYRSAEAGHVARHLMEFPMKKILLAAFTALSLTAAIAPMASAASMGTFHADNANNPTAGGGG